MPLVLPQDDAVDTPVLAALHFDKATWQDVEPLAVRAHAAEVYLALVVPQRTQMIVKIRRLAAGSTPTISDITVPVQPKTPAARAFASVADAAAHTIIDLWKGLSVVDFGRKSKLVALLHVDSIEAWGQMLQKLGTVPTITDVNVMAMDIGEARLAISYVGSVDQLNEQLARQGLDLANENGEWWLAQADSAKESQ